MAYDGTAVTPAAAQPPTPQNNIQMQYAIAQALLGHQPKHMQSWLQPMAQMAQAAMAGKYMNAAAAAQRANAQGMLGPSPTAAATPAASAGVPTGTSNPIAALFAGGGAPGGIPTLEGAPY